jgi:hypothetical protein
MGMMKPQKVGVEAMEDRVERLAHPEGFSPAGLKVLVVDDDLLCLMILERMLAQCKYTGVFRPSKPILQIYFWWMWISMCVLSTH